MTEGVAGKMVMGGAVVTSLGMSCRSGAAISAAIPAFTPQTLAVKLGAAGLGCLGGMLSSVASAALFARDAQPAELSFDTIDTSHIDMSAIAHLPDAAHTVPSQNIK